MEYMKMLECDNEYIKGNIGGDKLKLDFHYVFHIEELKKKSYRNMEYVGETIETIVKSNLSYYKFDIKERKFYAYLMREIMRNSVEHSEADVFELFIYSNTVGEFAFKVIDSGIGLKKSLENNPNYSLQDDKTALAFAIRPGITRSWKRDPLRDDVWQNSGFGLYMVSSIINDIGGRFEISTGKPRLMFKNGFLGYLTPTNKIKSRKKGTEVLCVFNTKTKVNISTLIKEVSMRGNQYAKGNELFSEYSTIKTASKASTLI